MIHCRYFLNFDLIYSFRNSPNKRINSLHYCYFILSLIDANIQSSDLIKVISII